MLTIRKGDFGYAISDSLENYDGTPFDLTGYTVKFKAWKPIYASWPFVNTSASVITATSGAVAYTLKAGDFNIVGSYMGAFEALTGTTSVITFDPFEIDVVEVA